MSAPRYHHNGFKGWISPLHDHPDMTRFLDELPALLKDTTSPSVAPIKTTGDRKVYVVQATVDGRPMKFHVKYDHFSKSGSRLKAIKYAFLDSRGKKAWRAGIYAKAHGIPTPAPIALLERRVGPFLTEGLFIAEYAEGLDGFMSYYGAHFYKKNDREAVHRKRRLTERLAELVARMHRSGICHGDLKKNNISVMPGADGGVDFLVLDLENAEIRDSISTPERIEDLGCLAYSLVRYTSAADRFRFYKKYCDLENIAPKAGKRLAREIDRWIERKIDRKIHRDKDWEWARKILVVRNDNIGDVICTTPVLEALRWKYPKAHIAVLVAKYTKDAVEGNPFIDRVYTYQKAKHAGLAGESKLKAWIDQMRMIREIRCQRFDLAIGVRSKFTPSLGWLVFASGAPIRVGHRPRPKDRILSFFFNVFADEENTPRHEVERALNVVRRMGVDIDQKRLALQVPESSRSEAEAFIRDKGLKKGKQLVCLHLTRRMEENRWWSPDNYVKVARHLVDRGDVDLVLNWTPKDRQLADDVIKGLGFQPHIYSADGLKDFAGFVRECDLFITLEGGAMHVAAAVGTPTLAIFGSTSDIVWAPWGEKNITLRGGDHANSVRPESVIEAADRILGSGVGPVPVARLFR